MRIRRLCSSNTVADRHLENLRSWFCKRGYPKEVVDGQLKRVLEHGSALGTREKKDTGVPLVVTYHPHLSNLSRSIRKHFCYLDEDEEV